MYTDKNRKDVHPLWVLQQLCLKHRQFVDVTGLATIMFLRRVSGCDVISSCAAPVTREVAWHL